MTSELPISSPSATASRAKHGLDLGDAEFELRISKQLTSVENLLIERLSSGESFLTDVALHLVSAGGKRFRPLFSLLCAECGPDSDNDDVIRAATVTEMVHLATLYHDDVMDEAKIRRGVPAANARWNNSVAILAGDYLFAHSSMLLADLGPEAVGIIARTFAQLVTGQMRETVVAENQSTAQEDADTAAQRYLTVVWEKTGSLIAAAGRLGAMSSGADPETVETMARLGDCVGIAFQIADDIIDIASPQEESGKTPGTDLREGVHTLPMIYAMRSRDPQSARLRELLSAPIDNDAEVDEALQLLRNHTSMDQARNVLLSHVERAHKEIASLPDSSGARALRALVDLTVSRTG